jgi:hypothetical protein
MAALGYGGYWYYTENEASAGMSGKTFYETCWEYKSKRSGPNLHPGDLDSTDSRLDRPHWAMAVPHEAVAAVGKLQALHRGEKSLGFHLGRVSTSAGRSAICRRAGTCTCGRTASWGLRRTASKCTSNMRARFCA